MRLREHTAAACLFILIICATASVVAAQEFMQPPFVPPPPGTPSLLCGRFYFQAGVKYRNIESLKFRSSGESSPVIVATGTIPFGPTTPGNFGVGTGRNGFLGGAGAVWTYDNGFIAATPQTDTMAPGNATTMDSFGFAAPVCQEQNPTPPPDQIEVLCTDWDDWEYFGNNPPNNPELGRYRVGLGGCCADLDSTFNLGTFQIWDPTLQVNNFGGPIRGTTQVTFDLAIRDSLVLSAGSGQGLEREMGPQIWSPVFEVGFQLYDFFDLFYGFSWFNVNNSMGAVNVSSGTASHLVIRDTFPFYSDDDSNWSASNFNSASTQTSGTGSPGLNYHITPNSAFRGVFPNRQFLTGGSDASAEGTTIQEAISNKAQIDVYEFRAGSRTWMPLFGLGRMGVIMGGAFMPAHYKITGSRQVMSLGPAAPGALFNQTAVYKDWRPHYGAFLGADLELGYGSVYCNASIDYTWASEQSYRLFTVETAFSPGGMTVAVTGGFHF